MITIDMLLLPEWIVPIVPRGAVLLNHAVVVNQGLILDVLPADEALQKYVAIEKIHLPMQVLMPGLINLHTHAAMTVMRGLADDLPLMRWLTERIWPAETSGMSDEFVYDGTLLGIAEMLRSGTTCFSDMYFYPEAAARAVDHSGIRGCIGLTVIDFPTPYATDADDYLNKGFAMRDQVRDHDRITTCLAPHAPYTVGDRTFEKIVTYAEQLSLNIHTHLHETQDEISQSIQQFGIRPLQRMEQLGLLGPGFIAAHGVHLNEREIETLHERGCHIAHCPSSNLKLASGIAPVGALLKAGVNVGLGTDGAASNNRLDMFNEMRLAALLAKGVTGDAELLPAWQALEMATIAAAKALGLEAKLGSIEIGKSADLIAVDFSAPETQPCYDPISHLVYVAGRDQVQHVWVGGKHVLKFGELQQVDQTEIVGKAKKWQKRLNNQN